MFIFRGHEANKGAVKAIQVRDTSNFNWTFVFILAVVFYVYWSELHKKNYDAVVQRSGKEPGSRNRISCVCSE